MEQVFHLHDSGEGILAWTESTLITNHIVAGKKNSAIKNRKMLREIWQQWKKMNEKKALILLYHQVCERKSDPWQLAVHPEKFELQLKCLKNKFDVVSVEELLHCMFKQRLRKNMIAITFDDGFADNYTNAAPLLEWYGLPATFYLATDLLKNPKFYWWDELQSIVLHTQSLPVYLEQKIEDESVTYYFRRHHVLNGKSIHEINTWNCGMKVPNERIDLYMKLWKAIQPLSPARQHEVLEQLRRWAGLSQVRCWYGQTMQVYQMQKLCRNSAFSMGAHSVNHTLLGAHGESDQRFEIRESKRVLENLAGKNVMGFAYPYGNFNAVTKSLLKEAGFQYAVSAESRAVTADTDLFELPRIQVKNWGAEEFAAHLNMILN